jgi:DNA-binding NarL/FixJ family response regulator
MKQGKVILADNHQNMLAGVWTLLESMFATVFIVADLSLPVTKEINIARRLKKAFPLIRLIILSVHDERAAISECIEAGASAVVLKRSAVNALVPAVGAVMKGEIYVSPSTE